MNFCERARVWAALALALLVPGPAWAARDRLLFRFCPAGRCGDNPFCVVVDGDLFRPPRPVGGAALSGGPGADPEQTLSSALRSEDRVDESAFSALWDPSEPAGQRDRLSGPPAGRPRGLVMTWIDQELLYGPFILYAMTYGQSPAGGERDVATLARKGKAWYLSNAPVFSRADGLFQMIRSLLLIPDKDAGMEESALDEAGFRALTGTAGTLVESFHALGDGTQPHPLLSVARGRVFDPPEAVDWTDPSGDSLESVIASLYKACKAGDLAKVAALLDRQPNAHAGATDRRLEQMFKAVSPSRYGLLEKAWVTRIVHYGPYALAFTRNSVGGAPVEDWLLFRRGTRGWRLAVDPDRECRLVLAYLAGGLPAYPKVLPLY